jgi:hypothetical protein
MSEPAPRYDIELSVRLVPGGSDAAFTGTSENISETGVLVLAERLEPRGALLYLEFPVFEARGEVIWTRETEEELQVLLGMRFLALGGKTEKRS